MNEDRIEGAATELGGKVKDAVGGVLGDGKTQAEGKLDQISGSLQNAYGSAKDTLRDTAGAAGGKVEDFVAAQPIVALLLAFGAGFALSRLFDRE